MSVDNLFVKCPIALDARTGKRVWLFQSLRHNLWDHDLPVHPDAGKLRTRAGEAFVAFSLPE